MVGVGKVLVRMLINHGDKCSSHLTFGHQKAQLVEEGDPAVMWKKLAREVTDDLKLEGLFASFDADGDGEIDADELGKIFASLGHRMGMQELKDMIKQKSTTGTKTGISLQELKDLWHEHREPASPAPSPSRTVCDDDGLCRTASAPDTSSPRDASRRHIFVAGANKKSR